MTKARLHAVALIAPKSWILKFETKKDAEISPRSSVPRLENFQSKTQTRNKEINEAFSSRDSCSIALLDQYFNHSHKLVTVDLLGRHYVPIPRESEGIPDSVCDVPLCNNPTPLEALKEHSETIIDSNNDSSSSDEDSYENIDYVDASPPDVEIVSLEVIEIVIPEVGGIDTNILLTIKDDILREKLLNVNLLIANIEALKDNPAPSSDVMTKSSSTSLNLFLEETNTFDNSSPESETFYFDLEENSSGSTTTRSDYSLPDYEAFYDDHIEEKSSGSTTTLADFSQYDPFIFGLSINPFPPADKSDFYHEEFADGLTHVISPSEYDHFCFKIEPELGNLTMYVVEDIFPTREPRVHVPNVLTTHPTFHLDTDFILFSEPLFAIPLSLHIFSPPRMKIPFLIPASNLSLWHCRVISKLRAKFQSEWSSFETLLWRGHTNRGCPGSPDVPHGPINSGDGSSIATLNKRFVGGTPCLSVVDFPDCEDSRARSIHKSFTSSASFWKSSSREKKKENPKILGRVSVQIKMVKTGLVEAIDSLVPLDEHLATFRVWGILEAPDFNPFFKIKNLEHQIQEKDNVIRYLKGLVANVNDRSCEPYNAKDATALIEQNDCVRVELEKGIVEYVELALRQKVSMKEITRLPSTPCNYAKNKQVNFSDKTGTYLAHTDTRRCTRSSTTNIPVIPYTGGRTVIPLVSGPQAGSNTYDVGNIQSS
ncbi:hypothetical protein Tco_0404971 [Tanacetum coccineum]